MRWGEHRVDDVRRVRGHVKYEENARSKRLFGSFIAESHNSIPIMLFACALVVLVAAVVHAGEVRPDIVCIHHERSIRAQQPSRVATDPSLTMTNNLTAELPPSPLASVHVSGTGTPYMPLRVSFVTEGRFDPTGLTPLKLTSGIQKYLKSNQIYRQDKHSRSQPTGTSPSR